MLHLGAHAIRAQFEVDFTWGLAANQVQQNQGGGLNAEPTFSEPGAFSAILHARVWQQIATGDTYYHHNAMFQPVGGMDMIAKAFTREVGDVIKYGVGDFTGTGNSIGG